MANVIFGAYVGSFSSLLPAIMNDVNVPYSEGGLIGSAFFAGYLISQVPFAMMAERLGRWKVISSGLVFYTLTHLVFATSSTWTEILFYRFIQGFIGGAVFIPSLQLAFTVEEKRRSFATGFVACGFNIGTGMGAVYSFNASVNGGWQTGLIYSTMAFATIIPVASLLTFPTHQRRPQNSRPSSFHRDTAFYFLNLLHFVRLGVIIAVTTWMPTALAEVYGMTGGLAASYAFVLQLAGIASLTLGGYITDLLGKSKMLALNIAALAGILATAPSIPGWLAPIHMTALGFLVYLPTPAAFAILRDRYPEGVAGVAAGYLNTSAAAGAIAMPHIFGVLLEAFGGFAASFYTAAAFYTLLLPFIPLLSKK
ncbi:Multidrug resistance protein MdtL [archaeon HR01]|nr:Multidrug resistance protein MdtL [archaeon HR01]